MNLVEVLSSAAVTTILLAVLAFLLRGLITTRLTAAVKHEYEQKIEMLKFQLQRENGEVLSRLQKDLDVVREKELGGHRDKLVAYRQVVEVMAQLYAEIQHAARSNNFDQGITDRYNQAWVRCYGYLSLLAPQAVMDAYDRLNDYILRILSGRSPIQEWPVSREYGLAFINAVRADVNLAAEPVVYGGDL
jgi:hypothetical protein